MKKEYYKPESFELAPGLKFQRKAAGQWVDDAFTDEDCAMDILDGIEIRVLKFGAW